MGIMLVAVTSWVEYSVLSVVASRAAQDRAAKMLMMARRNEIGLLDFIAK